MANEHPPEKPDGPTITESVVPAFAELEVPPAPTPPEPSLQRRRRKSASEGSSSGIRRSARRSRRADVGPEGADLFDHLEAFFRGGKTTVQSNTQNIAIVVIIIGLIIGANWLTRNPPASQVAQSTAGAATQTEEPTETANASGSRAPAEETPKIVTASAAVEPGTAATEMASAPSASDASVSAPAPSAPSATSARSATPETTTPSPTAVAAAPTAPIAGITVTTSIGITAALDPTRPPTMPPAAEPVDTAAVTAAPVATAPAPQTPPAAAASAPTKSIASAPARPQRKLPLPAYAGPDPFTNGGPLDLDGPTAQQQYRKLNVTRTR
ncbi:MAG: hypothetical protein HYV02_03925 [Deltaproteobacteria bacterium]|nr:hypothetical protein [Deltaproteobacteria bacterium]